MKTEQEFKQLVRKKIAGYYTSEGYYTRAIERIASVREEIIGLIQSVKKVDTTKLLEYMDSSGFFYRPSGPSRKHHPFPGGLAEHSLGVFRFVEEWNNMTPDERKNSELYNFWVVQKNVRMIQCKDLFTRKIDPDDIILAGICHDLCKADLFYFKGRAILAHHREDNRHSTLSKKRLMRYGVRGSECQEILLAVETHMHLFSYSSEKEIMRTRIKGRKSALAITVWAADKLDASKHPGKKTTKPSTTNANNQN